MAKFDLDPGKRGLNRVLGDLENEVMEILWDGSPATVHDVHRRLRERRKVAYTTVMTVMARLAEKGLLEREKKGYSYRYQAVCSRREYTHSLVGSVLEGLVRDFGSPVVHQLLEKVENDEGLMEELERLIERRRADDA